MILGASFLEWYFSITVAYFIAKVLVGGDES